MMISSSDEISLVRIGFVHWKEGCTASFPLMTGSAMILSLSTLSMDEISSVRIGLVHSKGRCMTFFPFISLSTLHKGEGCASPSMMELAISSSALSMEAHWDGSSSAGRATKD